MHSQPNTTHSGKRQEVIGGTAINHGLGHCSWLGQHSWGEFLQIVTINRTLSAGRPMPARNMANRTGRIRVKHSRVHSRGTAPGTRQKGWNCHPRQKFTQNPLPHRQ